MIQLKILNMGWFFVRSAERKMTFDDCVVKKDYLFLRNIYDEDDLKNSHAIKHVETCYKNFKRFIECSLLIKKYYKETFTGNNLNKEYKTFAELYNAKNRLQIKNSGFF